MHCLTTEHHLHTFDPAFQIETRYMAMVTSNDQIKHKMIRAWERFGTDLRGNFHIATKTTTKIQKKKKITHQIRHAYVEHIASECCIHHSSFVVVVITAIVNFVPIAERNRTGRWCESSRRTAHSDPSTVVECVSIGIKMCVPLRDKKSNRCQNTATMTLGKSERNCLIQAVNSAPLTGAGAGHNAPLATLCVCSMFVSTDCMHRIRIERAHLRGE